MKVPVTQPVHKASTSSAKLLRKTTAMVLAVLVMLFAAQPIFAQNNIRVKGRVTGEGGTGVPNATVTVKGTTSSTISDANGNFEIDVASNGTLVFSSAGYESAEIAVRGQTTINTSLKLNELEQVVVVGYGTQRKKDVTGSVVSVSGETLKEVAAPNVIAQLKGRTAGVDIVSNSSTPGGGGQIRIRGNRSLSNDRGTLDALDQPLLVVDGIPYGGSINDLNPEDIASLEILKDASATAIYGSRGSGGVILITMKRGKAGKAVFGYDGYYGISNVLDKLHVMNGKEYAQFKLDAGQPNTYGLTNAEQAALAAGVSTDWQDLIYQQGFTSSNQLSITGGSNGTTYSLGGGYFNETGIIPNQRFERYSVRIAIDHQVNKRIKIGASVLNTLTYSNTPGGGGVTSGLVRLTPLASPYNPDGTVNLLPWVGATDGTFVSPLTLITKKDAILARNRRLRTFNSLYGEVNIIDGLKYRLNVGLDFREEKADTYNGPLTYTNTATAFSQANASVGNSEAYSWVFENLLIYEKTFKEKHRIGFTGLFSAQKDHAQGSGFNGLGFPADYVQNTNLTLANSVTANTTAGVNSFAERGLISYMARLNYGYDNRYLLTATVRRDGSSVLSPGNQYFTYPALAVGWNITNEEFMKNVSFLSNLKLRGGWGKTSNQGVNPYATLGALNTSTYNFGLTTDGQQAAYLVTTLANNSLKWQSTEQWNVGLEFGLFNNRITGSVDVYEQKTKDIILAFNLPQSNGAGSTTKNLGKTKGHGVEVNLSSINFQSRSGFTWTTDVNFYFNREEVVQLQFPNIKQDVANGWFVGQPMTVIYDFRKLGIWQTKDAAAIAAQTSPVQKAGQIHVEDVNKDGKIDAADRQILGNFQPQWEGGLTNRFAYKNFDLTVVMYARMGMKVLVPYVTADGGNQGFPFFMQTRVNQLKVDYWTPNNPTNAFPQPDATTDKFLFASTLGYRDGSFIKCRSINLGYDVPKKVLGRSGLSSAKIYVTVVNPFILYSPFVRDGFGPDPEGNGYGGAVSSREGGGSVGVGGQNGSSSGRQVSVNANNPTTRQFLLGLNLKF